MGFGDLSMRFVVPEDRPMIQEAYARGMKDGCGVARESNPLA